MPGCRPNPFPLLLLIWRLSSKVLCHPNLRLEKFPLNVESIRVALNVALFIPTFIGTCNSIKWILCDYNDGTRRRCSSPVNALASVSRQYSRSYWCMRTHLASSTLPPSHWLIETHKMKCEKRTHCCMIQIFFGDMVRIWVQRSSIPFHYTAPTTAWLFVAGSWTGTSCRSSLPNSPQISKIKANTQHVARVARDASPLPPRILLLALT